MIDLFNDSSQIFNKSDVGQNFVEHFCQNAKQKLDSLVFSMLQTKKTNEQEVVPIVQNNCYQLASSDINGHALSGFSTPNTLPPRNVTSLPPNVPTMRSMYACLVLWGGCAIRDKGHWKIGLPG